MNALSSLPARPSSTWQLQDAKAQFSEVVRQAESRGPELISVREKPAAVVLSQAAYAGFNPDP